MFASMTKGTPIALCVAAAIAIAGCGGGSETVTVSASTDPTQAGSEQDQAVYSQGARLQEGSVESLLSTGTVKVRVKCEPDNAALVSVAVKGATADVVVSSYEGRGTLQTELDPGEPLGVPMTVPDIQTWTIAPFAEVSRTTTITVSARDVSGDGQVYDCGIMAQAIVGPEGGSISK